MVEKLSCSFCAILVKVLFRKIRSAVFTSKMSLNDLFSDLKTHRRRNRGRGLGPDFFV